MDQTEETKKEIEYCYYLNRIINHYEKYDTHINNFKKIGSELSEIESSLSEPSEYFKKLKINIIKGETMFCSCMLLVSYFFSSGSKYYDYVAPIAFSIISGFILYDQCKKDYNISAEDTKQQLIKEKELLEYIKWLEYIKFNELGGEFSCLSEKEWKEYGDLEIEFLFSRKLNL